MSAGVAFALGTLWGGVVALVSYVTTTHAACRGPRRRWLLPVVVIVVLGALGGVLGGLVAAS